jgi:hypothetical protein
MIPSTFEEPGMQHLQPCPRCARHVRVLEIECPFCGTELDLSATPPPILPTRRLNRAALFTFGATLVFATGACSGNSESTDKTSSGGASNGGSGGVTPETGVGASGGAIYGCGPLGTDPKGFCNVPDTGTGGVSGSAGAPGDDAGLAGSAGASGAAGSDASTAGAYGLPPDTG